MRCANCGAANGADALFCESCGRSLAPVPGAQVANLTTADATPTRADTTGLISSGSTSVPRHVVGSAAPATGAWEFAPPYREERREAGPSWAASAPRKSDATRYLCAATHLDSRFGDRVVEHLVERDFAAIPSSPGVDLGEIARHALLAQRRHRIRDALLVAAWVLLVVGLLVGHIAVVVISILVAWLIVLIESLIATYGVVARQLGPNAARSDAHRRDAELDRAALSDLSTEGNVTVYGGYNPFVGSGVALNAWSFVVRTTQPAEGRQVEPFTSLDIHDRVIDHVRSMDLDGLNIEDRVFVDGRAIHDDRRFLSQPVARPYTRVDPALVRYVLAHPEVRARTYICVRAAGWNDQLVLSTFVRFVVSQDAMFVELSHSLLTPVLERYQEADRLLPQPTFRQVLTLMGRSVTGLLRLGPLAPIALWRTAAAPVTRERRRSRERREITSGLRYNYGPAMSPREELADPRYQRYFQELDKDYYLKMVEQRVLEGVVDFLEAKGVDISDLVERQTTILNQGVYVSGGTVNATNIAAGTEAKAQTGATTRAKERPNHRGQGAS